MALHQEFYNYNNMTSRPSMQYISDEMCFDKVCYERFCRSIQYLVARISIYQYLFEPDTTCNKFLRFKKIPIKDIYK